MPPTSLTPLLTLLRTAHVRSATRAPGGGGRTSRRPGAESGQATAEYALVLLGAAVIAIALITWATGSGRIGGLFDAVFDELQSRL